MNAYPLTSAPTHLSEDDLDEVLLGFASAAKIEHTADCADCRARLNAFRTQLATFNQASHDWSVARSNTITRDLASHRPALRLTPATLWYSTAAAVLAVAFSFSTGLHRNSVNQQTAGAAQTDAVAEVTPNQGEIASDNAMLEAIDLETSTPRMAQFGLYETSSSHASTSTHASIRQVKE